MDEDLEELVNELIYLSEKVYEKVNGSRLPELYADYLYNIYTELSKRFDRDKAYELLKLSIPYLLPKSDYSRKGV